MPPDEGVTVAREALASLRDGGGDPGDVALFSKHFPRTVAAALWADVEALPGPARARALAALAEVVRRGRCGLPLGHGREAGELDHFRGGVFAPWKKRATSRERRRRLRPARAGGVHAPAELEGGSQAGRRMEGELGALRQRDGREAREGREVLDREGAAAEVSETDHQLQQGRVGHRGDVGGSERHRAPPRAEGRSAGASAWWARRRSDSRRGSPTAAML
ncbi:hypothetical protein WME99_32765 [Sorangium sp. So ce136]|uniref:hypothetical protein n=1 Tax=Sorangium sp. So ce136 TaxID=3133284 RepID=UPI003F120B64